MRLCVYETVLYNNLTFATESDEKIEIWRVFCGQMRQYFIIVQYFRLSENIFVPFDHKPCV